MANRKQRRHAGKPHGASYADVLMQQKYQQAVCAAAVHDHAVQVQSEIRTQRVLWMCCIAMNRAFGIGPKRFLDFTKELDWVTAWYEKKSGRGRRRICQRKASAVGLSMFRHCGFSAVRQRDDRNG